MRFYSLVYKKQNELKRKHSNYEYSYFARTCKTFRILKEEIKSLQKFDEKDTHRGLKEGNAEEIPPLNWIKQFRD